MGKNEAWSFLYKYYLTYASDGARPYTQRVFHKTLLPLSRIRFTFHESLESQQCLYYVQDDWPEAPPVTP